MWKHYEHTSNYYRVIRKSLKVAGLTAVAVVGLMVLKAVEK